MGSIFSLIRFSMIGTGLCLIGIAVLGIVFAPNLEPLARQYVEGELGKTWQSETSVEGIGFSFWDQAIELVDVAVANPPGLEKNTAVEFARVLVQPDLMSLFSGKPTLEEVRLEGAQVQMETLDPEGMAVEDLVEQLELPSKTEAEKQDTVGGWLMRRFSSDGTQVQVSGPQEQAPVSVDVEAFRVETPDGGVDAQELGNLFFSRLVSDLLTTENLKKLLDAVPTEASS